MAEIRGDCAHRVLYVLDFRIGEYLPKSGQYRHIFGEVGHVVAACANPSKEFGDM